MPIPPINNNLDIPSVTITTDEVLEGIESFKKGAGCAKSGLRVEHLKDMINSNEGDFLNSLTAILQIIMDGKAPVEFAPFFASGPLIPLLKKVNSTDIRPITVGEVIRRLGSKILAKRLKSQVMELFKSMQVGVAVHNGAEAIINGLNALLDVKPTVYGIPAAVNKLSNYSLLDLSNLRK